MEVDFVAWFADFWVVSLLSSFCERSHELLSRRNVFSGPLDLGKEDGIREVAKRCSNQ